MRFFSDNAYKDIFFSDTRLRTFGVCVVAETLCDLHYNTNLMLSDSNTLRVNEKKKDLDLELGKCAIQLCYSCPSVLKNNV